MSIIKGGRMRNIMFFIVFLAVATVATAGTFIFEGGVSRFTTEQVNYFLAWETCPGDTIYLQLTEPSALVGCWIIPAGRTVIVHPESSPIYVDREVIPGYPINTITILDSGAVAGIDAVNTSGTGSILWGRHHFVVRNCNFGEAVTAVSCGDSADVEIRDCSFSEAEKPLDLQTAGDVFLKDNIFENTSGDSRIEVMGGSQVFVCENEFGSGCPIQLEIQANGDSIHITKNLLANESTSAIDAIRIGGSAQILFDHNTIDGGHNGFSVEDGSLVNAEIHSNIYVNLHCGSCSFTNMLAPRIYSHNHFYNIRGDYSWAVVYGGSVNGPGDHATFGDPGLDVYDNLFPTSFLCGGGYDETDVGRTGGDTLWFHRAVSMEVPADSDYVENPAMVFLTAANPFNSSVALRFTQPAKRVEIHDLTGRLVTSRNQPGNNFTWTAPDVPSGTYLATVRFSDKVVTTKVTLVR
jgi:hypothetical protein